MRKRVHVLPHKVISRYSNTYAKKSKRLGILGLPLGRLKMVISTYSNILLSVSMINMTNGRVRCSRERPLGLFEILARNRQSAVGLWTPSRAHAEQSTRMFTIPPRQQLSSPTQVGDTSTASYSFTDKNKKNQSNIYNTQTHTTHTVERKQNFPS